MLQDVDFVNALHGSNRFAVGFYIETRVCKNVVLLL